MPHQQHMADVLYELDDDGSLHYGEGGIVLGRQEGKSELKIAMAVHRMTVMARLLGPQRCTFTMQTRAKARKKLEQDYGDRLRGSASFREVVNAKARPQRASEWMLRLNNGAEHIQFGRASYLQIDAPSRTGTHGDTLDSAFIDEAFAHQDDAVETSMTPTMITRRSTQLVVLSAAGDAKSRYLYRKILAGRAACGSGDHGRSAYFEWSAPDDLDPSDPATWRLACPAMGFTITKQKLEAEWLKALREGQAGIDRFRRSFLCQWPEVPVLDDEAAKWVIPEADWSRDLDRESQIAGPLFFAYDVSNDFGWSSVSACGARPDLLPQIEVVEHRPGTEWLPGRLKELQDRHRSVAVMCDPASAAGSQIPAVVKAGVEVKTVSAREYAQACGLLYDLATTGRIRHIGQPELTAALAGACTRSLLDAWAWDRKHSSVVISPLVACTLALHGFSTAEPQVAAATAPSAPAAGDLFRPKGRLRL